jgi:hypothetical protein
MKSIIVQVIVLAAMLTRAIANTGEAHSSLTEGCHGGSDGQCSTYFPAWKKHKP